MEARRPTGRGVFRPSPWSRAMLDSVSTAPGRPLGRPPSTVLRRWRTRLAPDPALPLEARLFQVIAFVAAAGTLGALLPTNLPAALNASVAVFGLVALWVWRESRHGRQRPVRQPTLTSTRRRPAKERGRERVPAAGCPPLR